MEHSKILVMIQQSKHKWRLETASGHILTEDLVINNAYDAERYGLNYISSFQNGWEVILKPIKTREVK